MYRRNVDLRGKRIRPSRLKRSVRGTIDFLTRLLHRADGNLYRDDFGSALDDAPGKSIGSRLPGAELTEEQRRRVTEEITRRPRIG